MSTELFEAASMFKYYYLDHFPLLYSYPLGMRVDSRSKTFILVQLHGKWIKVQSFFPLFFLLLGGTLSFIACHIPLKNEDAVFQVEFYFWIAIIIMAPCMSALYYLWDIQCPNTACFMVAQMVELRLELKKEVGELSA